MYRKLSVILSFNEEYNYKTILLKRAAIKIKQMFSTRGHVFAFGLCRLHNKSPCKGVDGATKGKNSVTSNHVIMLYNKGIRIIKAVCVKV